MCLYYGTYLQFCVYYPESVSFIEFLMDLCTYDEILNVIQITDKKLLQFKVSNSGQILHVDKTCFPRPGHIFYIAIHALFVAGFLKTHGLASCYGSYAYVYLCKRHNIEFIKKVI